MKSKAQSVNRNFALIHDWKKETENLKKTMTTAINMQPFLRLSFSQSAIEKFFNNFRDHHLVTWDDVNFTVDFFVFFFSYLSSRSLFPPLSALSDGIKLTFLCLSVRTWNRRRHKVNKESLLWVIFNKIVKTFMGMLGVYVETTKVFI